MFRIEYRKPLRLAAMIAMGLKILYQLFCVVFFREALPLWAIGVLAVEIFAICMIYRNQRDFFTALPWVLLAVLENVLFFSSNSAMQTTTSFHLMTTIVLAIHFIFSMAGRMYEHRTKLVFILVLLIASWGYDLFLAIFNSPEFGPLDLVDIRILILCPVAFGLSAAWAAFPRMVHDLSDEEIAEKLEKNKQMVATGRMSIAEYNEEAMLLVKGRQKK